jgi:hypothetical protein
VSRSWNSGFACTPGHLAKVPGSPELRPKPQLRRRDPEFLCDVKERAGPILKTGGLVG